MKEFLATLLCTLLLVPMFMGVLGISITVNNPPRFEDREQIEKINLDAPRSRNRHSIEKSKVQLSKVKPVKLYNSVTGLEIETHERSGNLVREMRGEESIADIIERVEKEFEKPVNNPGNLRRGDGSFYHYRSPKEGYLAMKRDIQLKIAGESSSMKAKLGENYRPTIKNLIEVYAPPHENDTKHYINFVSTRARIAPDKPLKISDANRIIPHMILLEKGHKEARIYQQFFTEIVAND